MRNLFNLDGPLMQLINKVVYSVYLNILWFICCIPIVTIGASTTALFYVTLKIAKNDEGNITKAFFHSFRVNLKQSTIVWMILLCMGIILGVDGYVVYHMRYENAFWTLCTAFLIIAAAAYAIVLMYIFPLMARFENTISAMFKNAVFVLHHINGCHLFCNAAGCSTLFYPGYHFWGRPVRIALLMPAVQYPAALSGKNRI